MRQALRDRPCADVSMCISSTSWTDPCIVHTRWSFPPGVNVIFVEELTVTSHDVCFSLGGRPVHRSGGGGQDTFSGKPGTR